jgi:hypothetical protein
MTVRIGDLALAAGVVTGAQLEQARALQKANGAPLGAKLVSLGYLSEEQVADPRGQALPTRPPSCAHLATLEAPAVPARTPAPVADPRPLQPPAVTPPVPEPDLPASGPPEPDDTAAAFAADRMQSARLFDHYGLHAQAREQLEELLKSLPEHLKGRQHLVEVCRVLGDDEAAAQHFRIVTHLMRQQGVAPAPAREEPVGLPPFEEWARRGGAARERRVRARDGPLRAAGPRVGLGTAREGAPVARPPRGGRASLREVGRARLLAAGAVGGSRRLGGGAPGRAAPAAGVP